MQTISSFHNYASVLRCHFFGLLVRKWGILQQKLGCSLNTNSGNLVACGRLHNYVLANNNIDIEQPLNYSTSLPSGFENRPIRVEDRHDLEEFIENSVLGSCRNKDIIVYTI